MRKIEIDGFEIKDCLGVGGMATVWRARQCSLDRFVAIKILAKTFSINAEDITRFTVESRVAARLKHHGIVQVIDAGTRDEMYYFIMEYVDGYTVGEWLRRKGRLPESDVLDVAECVAEALAYAWRLDKVVHCDIKPDNIMVDADGTVKVMDLGLARTIRRMHSVLPDNDVLGTPAYMSPEQSRGDETLDFRADIYSLGATLYHLVSGKMLFEEFPEALVMDRQIDDDDIDIFETDAAPSIPFCYLIEKMLAKNPEERHASWEEVKSDLADVRQGLMPPGISSFSGRSTMRRSRLRLRASGSLAGVFVLNRMLNTIRCKLFSSYVDNPYRRLVACLGISLLLLILIISLMELSRSCGTSVPDFSDDANRVIPGTPMKEAANVAVSVNSVTNYLLSPHLHSRSNDTLDQDAPEEAREALKRIMARRKNQSDQCFNDLRMQAETLVKARKAPEAVALLRDYNGRYASQTEDRRNKLASEIEDEERQFHQAVKMSICKAADLLYRGDRDGAFHILDRMEGDNPSLAFIDYFQEIKEIIGDLANMDGTVVRSFQKELGREVELQLAGGGSLKGRLVSINNETAVVRHAPGNIDMSLALSRLSWREIVKRMPGDQSGAAALYRGVIAARKGDLTSARKAFSDLPELLSDALLDAASNEK